MESIFLGLFLFGFLMVVVSALLGFAHLALPGGHDGFHMGQPATHGNQWHGTHSGTTSGTRPGLPLWNVSSLLAFLMWFGAAGYVAMTVFGLAAPLALLPAVGCGVVGGLLVSAFLRMVLRGETEMDPHEYRMEGTLARVSVSIPAGGTGEIIFSKGDRRRSEGARSIDGTPITRGDEVVVLEYQRGIALVQAWRDFVDTDDQRALNRTPELEA